MEKKNLDDLLETWLVDYCFQTGDEQAPEGWFAVNHNHFGVVAYFAKEVDALRFRLDCINHALNPSPWSE